MINLHIILKYYKLFLFRKRYYMKNLIKFFGVLLISSLLFSGTINAEDKNVTKKAKKGCCSKANETKSCDKLKHKCETLKMGSKESTHKCTTRKKTDCKESEAKKECVKEKAKSNHKKKENNNNKK